MCRESLEEQAYKIIINYAYTEHNIASILENDRDKILDFIHYAYIYVLDRINKYYNKDKGKLTTFIYSVLNNHCVYNTFLNQAKYNVSESVARTMSRCNDNTNKKEIMSNLYIYPKPINSCSTELDNNIENIDNGKTKVYDTALMTKSGEPDGSPEDYFNENSFVLDFINRKIDEYFKIKIWFEDYDMHRDIIIRYIFDDSTTLQSLGDEYNVTRERIRQIVKKFTDFLKNDKEFKDLYFRRD